ncbi:MAG: tetratricopeptide repeat protein [Lactobacillales bacterium]|jgi:tetratricopeptide (TPR) repeat protein|nr:tetratricopeptide repeat protein [Lactobacillales bacterium]
MNKNKELKDALLDGNSMQAKKFLKQILENDSPEELVSLAEELKRLGFIAEEKQIYEWLLQKFPDELEWYLSLAEIAIEEGETDEAFSYLDKIPEESSLYISSLMMQADIYQLLEIPEVSEAKLKRALEIEPDEPLLNLALAEIYYEQGRFQNAISLYALLPEEWLREETGVCLYERIGSAYSMDGHFEAAIEFLEKALDQPKANRENILTRLGALYLQMKETERAIQLYSELHSMCPLSSEYILPFARALVSDGNLESAHEVIDYGISENPYQVDYYLYASKIAYQKNDKKQAEEYLLRALKLDEKDMVLLSLLNLYVEQERFNDAVMAYQDMEEENALACWLVAKAYLGLEDYKTANSFFKQALEEYKEDPEFLKEYVFFLREEGKFKEAKAWAILALKLQSDDEELLSFIEE